jgi:hypothetical protein
MPVMTQEVLPGGYWLQPVLFEDFLTPARPGVNTVRQRMEVPANEPPEFPLSAPGEVPPPAPLEEPPRTPLEVPRPHRGRKARCA